MRAVLVIVACVLTGCAARSAPTSGPWSCLQEPYVHICVAPVDASDAAALAAKHRYLDLSGEWIQYLRENLSIDIGEPVFTAGPKTMNAK